MKILESQNALLSNYEVYQFLQERKANAPKPKARGKKARVTGTGNLDTIVAEVLQYLQDPPAPLSQQPTIYSAEAVTELVKRLRPYDLAKGEVLMILNMRPQTGAQLYACIDEAQVRLTEDQQFEIMDIVAELLGAFPVAEEEEGEEGDYAEDGGAVGAA